MTRTATKWNDARFVHINSAEQKQTLGLKRTLTIAYRYNDADQLIEFSIAECSKKDTFCKRIGRSVSYGRLKDTAKALIHVIPYESIPDLGFKAVTTAVVTQALTQVSQN